MDGRTDRFKILGVIDSEKSGQDAEVIVDGNVRVIPVFASLKHDFEKLSTTPEVAIVGITPSEGRLMPELFIPLRKLSKEDLMS